ncbi:aspartyl-phosphate phosphatase Spo0E family protein [Salinibacillus xinjiangensis]|uniref:Spo0E family sporulation regulatory protein-aspartic acid phosphatase n=1 Tax=Salinibacillus xinjiangensis TaxID=1229268 RepID=A0A6G1X9D3_9BACI|nr:aspartyl-phosphate phosphatase Spo0E family protein [Salinibacillus xinjiangensis]MRG87584.1 Spo0E family sporulation regulatory protein-aspartic acid phosphatase [Salinibacillus xinjiangensis]
MNHLKEKELQNKIYAKRKKMIELGLTKGLHHKETLWISQELDRLINKLQR